MSVARCQDEVDSFEFSEWLAYENFDPGDPERSDLRTAVICRTVMESQRVKGRKPQIKDFLLKFKIPVAKQSVQSIKEKMTAWVHHQAALQKLKGKKHGSKNHRSNRGSTPR